MEKNKFEGFTLTMALVDALPVVFFGGSSVLLGTLFKSSLFIFGAALCFFAGLCKVIWKIIVSLTKKDVRFLFMQMRFLMPVGFLLMILSLILGFRRISLPAMLAGLTGMPQLIFFILWVAGMIAMGVLAKKLDSFDAKSNWIEQAVNGAAQMCLFIGLLIVVL